MEIKKDYDVYELMCNCWSGAEDTLRTVINNGLEDEFVDLFYEIFGNNIPSLTEVNDWLRFEWEDIFAYLGIEEGNENE